MALIKQPSGYGSSFTVDLGEKLDDVQEEQLNVTAAELIKAINQENITDRLFARILRNRSKSHEALLVSLRLAGLCLPHRASRRARLSQPVGACRLTVSSP